MNNEQKRPEPPITVKIVLVGLVTCFVMFLLFCVALILLWMAKGLWSVTFG